LAGTLNNATNRHSELSPFQQTQEEKLESLEIALGYAEEAIEIGRSLGSKYEVSIALNDASILHSEISHFQQVSEKNIYKEIVQR
jgi:hypothetical protein